MHHDSDDDAHDSPFDRIYHATCGATPHLPHRVRDEIALIRQLPPCQLRVVAQHATPQAALATYPAVFHLPRFEQAELMDGPEHAWQGWQWADWEYLLIYVTRDPHLPRLGSLTAAAPSHCQLMVHRSPMRIRRFSPGDSEWRGEGFSGDVAGFLDERTQFWAQSVAPTAERRDKLLAAIGTLRGTAARNRSSR